MRPGGPLVFVVFGLASVAALVGVEMSNFEKPPAYDDFPPGWFDRPARADPKTWVLPGVTRVRIANAGAIRLEVIPEDRGDVAATLTAGSGDAPQPLAIAADGTITVAGDRKAGCRVQQGAPTPTVVLRTPRSVAVHTTGPVAGSVGPAEQMLLVSDACADWRVGQVRRLWLALAQGGDVHASGVDDLRLAISGKGLVQFGHVGRSLDAVLRGPPRLSVDKADGMIDVDAWGRAQVDIAAGVAGDARLFDKGPGHILDRGEVGALIAEGRLNGKVKVAMTRGLVTASGEVEVGRPREPIAAF